MLIVKYISLISYLANLHSDLACEHLQVRLDLLMRYITLFIPWRFRHHSVGSLKKLKECWQIRVEKSNN